MGYEGPHPLPVQSGGLGVSTVTGIITNNGGSAVTGNAITQYNTLSGGASSTINNIPPSATTGYGLCSNGVSSQPTFRNIPGSSLVFLGSQTASVSASLTFTSLISSAYSTYFVDFYSVTPSTTNRNLNCRFSIDNGANWIATDYLGGTIVVPYNSTTWTAGVSTTAVQVSTNISSLSKSNGYLWLYNLVGSNQPCVIGRVSGTITTNAPMGRFSGTNTANTNINALQFFYASSNMATGTFNLYGVKQS